MIYQQKLSVCGPPKPPRSYDSVENLASLGQQVIKGPTAQPQYGSLPDKGTYRHNRGLYLIKGPTAAIGVFT